jgi:ribosome-binding factor A
MPHGTKGTRPLRIAAEIKRDLPDLIRRHVTLPPGVLLSITDVEVTEDLGQARVFFSVLGPQEQRTAQHVAQELNHKRGVLRTEIAHRLVMRQHPELKFIYDETPARAARIEQLLNEIQKESPSPDAQDSE